MVLICVKLADKITIKKIIFLYTDMPVDSFLGAITYSFYFAGAIFGLLFAGLWLDEKLLCQDEQIEELSSRLKDCEGKNDELKK